MMISLAYAAVVSTTAIIDHSSQITFMLLSLVFIVFAAFVITIVTGAVKDRKRHKEYYVHLGTPAPAYHFWYMWGGPHRVWWFGPGGPGGTLDQSFQNAVMMHHYSGMRTSSNRAADDSVEMIHNTGEAHSDGFGGFGNNDTITHIDANSIDLSGGMGEGGGGFGGGGGGRE